jgi:hypothetical protein
MVEDLIRRARRRLIVNEALSQSALACALTIGGVALILVMGTRYLEWWTLALFAAAGIGIGIWHVSRHIPSEYATAVRVDRNAGLHDTLSTALYFHDHDPGSPEFREIQRSHAEAAAQAVSLDTAVPFTFPKALYAMAGLTLLASGLVVFRFASTKGLDLRAPLTEVLFEDLAAKQIDKKSSAAENADRKRLETAESLLAKLGVPIKDEDKKDEAALDKAIDQALEGAQSPADKGQKGAPGDNKDGKQGNGMQAAPDGDPLEGKNSDKDNSDKAQNGKDGKESPSDDVKKSSNSDSGSLFSKMKDAFNNMMSKAGKENNGGQQKGGDKQQQQQASKSDKAAGEKGQNSKGQEQNGQSQDAQDGEPSGDEQKDGQQAQGKSGSKSSQQSAQAGSGVGSQDGAKDLKAAEQMKAMGKLSEIIGKRSATVTGETTIEVQSGNQSLKTAYSNKTAAHGEADSDVSRDEIPVSMQPYVQQYFEQVHKSAGPKAKAASPAAAPAAKP